MARKPTFTPKLLGQKWYVYVPKRGLVNLETTDEKEAYTKAHQFQAEYETATPSTAPKPQAAPQGSPPSTAAEMLKAWASSPSTSAASSPSLPVTPQPQQSLFQPATPTSTSVTSTPSLSPTAVKVEAVMPADKRKKTADLLAKVATRLNVVAVAASVRLLGRIPAKDEDEDAETALQEGWSLQLEELFVSHPPAPWMIILGGSVAIGVGMYADGTPIPKKPKLAPPGGDDGNGESDANSGGPVSSAS